VIDLYSKDSKLFTILYLSGASLLISPCEAVLFWWAYGRRWCAPTGRRECLSGRSDQYGSASEAILVAGLTYIGRHHDLDETTGREEQRLEGEIM